MTSAREMAVGQQASGPEATDLPAAERSGLYPAAASDAAGAAVRAAESAARAAGVRIRTLTDLAGLDEVYRLYDGIWRPDPSNPPVTTELLRALTKAGNYVGAAFDGPRMVGACMGFFGAPADTALHSHIAGVASAALARSVGIALKRLQRAWAMQRGG